MKKRLLLIMVVLALFALPHASAWAATLRPSLPERVQKSGVIRIGSPQTYPPIEYRNPQTKDMQGVSVELLNEVAYRLGLTIEWVQSDYGALITGAKAGRFDLISGGISDQPEREKEVDFVNYMKTGTGILCLIDNASSFNDLRDFSGRKVAFSLGAKRVEAAVQEASDALAAEGKKAIETIMLPSASDAKIQLDLKRVDGYLNETPTLAYIMQQEPGKYAMVQEGRYIIADLITSWGFAKENNQLRDAVHRTMQDMFDDGTYREIMEKWGFAGGMLPEITINMPADARN